MEMSTGYAKCSPFEKTNVDLAPKSCKFTVGQLVWRIRISKLNLGLVPKSCKYMQMNCKPAGLGGIRMSKLNLGFLAENHANTCKYTVNQVVWRIRTRKVKFPKLNSHRGLEALVDMCLILDDQDPKSEISKIKFAS